jgi:hypothetical protein
LLAANVSEKEKEQKAKIKNKSIENFGGDLLSGSNKTAN